MSCSLILFPWSRPPSRNSVGPASSRSWTCGAPISLFVYGKATSGRRRSLPPQATMNTGSCRMAFPAPPSVFQGFMNEVFRVFLHRFVIVYIDDILIYSRNLAEHCHHVTQVLRQLRKHHLYLKLEVWVPPPHGSVPRLHPQCGWDPDRPRGRSKPSGTGPSLSQ